MKKILLSLVLAAGFTSFAQQRMVLIESFSQASCGPCAAANPALTTLLDANTAKAIGIKYQVSWPGYDPMNEQYPTGPEVRRTYYNVTGVPDRMLDGSPTASTNPTQAEIDNRYAVAAPVTMTINHSLSSNFTTADVTVTITAPAVWNPTNTVLHLAMIEKSIDFSTPPGTNGELSFHNVVRKMYNNESGTAVVASNFSTAGGSQTFTFTGLQVPSYIYDLSEVGFVAWVQNTTTKEVYQAGISLPQPLNNFGDVQALTNVTPFSCSSSLDGAVAVLENTGGNTITSCTVNYQVDNGTVQTAPFTGSLAVGATTNFTLPNIASTSGSHTLKVWMTNINNSGVTTPIGTTTTTFATIAANGASAPLAQNFAGTAFPYANWVLNSANGNNWVRNATAGAARYSFYTIGAGNSGEMICEPVNFTGIASPVLKFDVAYKQYSTENDRLEVFVSSDCGATWSSVWNEAGSTLANGLAASTASYVATAADFRTESVTLSSMGNQPKVFVKFVATSDYGNNLYVDNINMGNFLSVDENDAFAAVVYPNPATDAVNVDFDATGADYVINITDLSGRVISTIALSNATGAQKVTLNTESLSSGNYLISIESNGARTIKNFAVN